MKARVSSAFFGVAGLAVAIWWVWDKLREDSDFEYEEEAKEESFESPQSPMVKDEEEKVSARGQEVLAREMPMPDRAMAANPKALHFLSSYGREGGSAEDDLRLVNQTLQRFWLYYKDPDLLRVGSNESIVAGLAGRNPGALEFVNPQHGYIDEEGRLLDRWGEPLFFHPLSLTNIEVRSAGPDRRLYTEDDLWIGASTNRGYKE